MSLISVSNCLLFCDCNCRCFVVVDKLTFSVIFTYWTSFHQHRFALEPLSFSRLCIGNFRARVQSPVLVIVSLGSSCLLDVYPVIWVDCSPFSGSLLCVGSIPGCICSVDWISLVLS